MKPFILLLKIQLLGLFGINKTLHADPAKAKRTPARLRRSSKRTACCSASRTTTW